jgi:TrmH family RNA methyltransferase
MAAEEPIRSRANPLYRRLRALRQKGTAAELALLEGPRLVLEALAASVTLVECAVGPRGAKSDAGRAALEALARRRVPVRRMSDELVASLSEADGPQGMVAIACRPSFDEDALFRGTPLVLVADGVQNPGNLGGLLRTAEAAGATGAYLAPGCADPFSWKALRGSMGSAFRLPQVTGVALWEALDRVSARGLAVLATAAAGETRYDETDLRRPVAIVLGAEAAGLAPAVLARADGRLRIPVAPPVESLNVGVAAALVLYEAARQRGFAGRAAAS